MNLNFPSSPLASVTLTHSSCSGIVLKSISQFPINCIINYNHHIKCILNKYLNTCSKSTLRTHLLCKFLHFSTVAFGGSDGTDILCVVNIDSKGLTVVVIVFNTSIVGTVDFSSKSKISVTGCSVAFPNHIQC